MRTVANARTRLPLGPLAFVSDYINNEIYILNVKGEVTGTLTSSTGLAGPEGMSVTNDPRRLYVANTSADDILVYSSSGSPEKLNDGGAEPVDVSVDRGGNVAAENYGGSISCFVGGATSPTFTISGTSGTGTFASIYYGAFDASGNLYIDGFTVTGSAQIGEIVGGCGNSSNVVTDLTTANSITLPGGVQVERNGDIAILSERDLAIYAYDPPTGGSLGNPVTTTPLSGSGDPVTFSFTPASNDVLEADSQHVNAAVYAFPTGGSPIAVITLPDASLPTGTAIYPSEQY